MRMKGKGASLLVLSTLTACTGFSVRPAATERGPDPDAYVMMAATFEVACDSCRVEYGVEGRTARDVTDGGWSAETPLGTLRTGDKRRVVLRIRPIGDARILRASIRVDGRTVASCDEKEPGHAVDLSARVGAS
jgi:hypothetical protein